MATNANGADLIGKTIVVVNNDKIKYVIKSVDGDKLMTDFCMEGREPMPCPVPMEQLTKMVDAGTWKIDGEATATTAAEEPAATETEEVEEVQDVQPEEPKAETVKMKPEPKAKKSEPKAKAKSDTSHQHSVLKYETYTTKKGKTGAKIVGFNETDAAYLAGPELHGSATYERDKDGNKTFCLLFSHRYAKAAEDVCKALNAGKSVKDCQAIVDKATEERARQRDEWKQKREERRANKEDEPKGKTYTEAEVADLIKRVVAGDKEAMEIVNAMSKAA